jgi:hypothetical protein
MKLNEFVRSIETWCSTEEQKVLESINEILPLDSFTEHDQFVLESLIRKSLVIKVKGTDNVVYVYPNK